ncbi:hypothetical protein amrb99_76180 [Actinomadura sp. RB99]|nr:hypothetical protein [Actinomadura sp. RB99]
MSHMTGGATAAVRASRTTAAAGEERTAPGRTPGAAVPLSGPIPETSIPSRTYHEGKP